MDDVIRALRIIVVFPADFCYRLAAVLLLAFGLAGTAQAQSAYQLQMTVDFKGRTFTVAPTRVELGDRQELTVDPVGGLRVYLRAMRLPGAADQSLLDLQIYEPRGSSQSQVASLTMTAYLGTNNSAEVDVQGGKLVIGAYVDDAAKTPRPAPRSMGSSLPAPAPAPAAASASRPPPLPRQSSPKPYTPPLPEYSTPPDYSAPAYTPPPPPPRSRFGGAPQAPQPYYDPSLPAPKPIPIPAGG